MRDFQLVVIKLSGSSRLNVARAFMRVAGLIKNNFITNGVIRGIRGSRTLWARIFPRVIFRRAMRRSETAFRKTTQLSGWIIDRFLQFVYTRYTRNPRFCTPEKPEYATRNRIFSSRVASSGSYRESLVSKYSPRDAIIEDNFARPI